jgi:hypothetical protein
VAGIARFWRGYSAQSVMRLHFNVNANALSTEDRQPAGGQRHTGESVR